MRSPDIQAPIGVFDSGVGGLTIARAITEVLPHENIRYIADSAHQPYGSQSLAHVRRHALSVLDSLVEQGAKLLVIACNSASIACLADARERFTIPVVEVVMPAVRSALAATRTGCIGVIGTHMTVAARAYEDSFAAVAPHTRVVSAACPRFVDFIEQGIVSGAVLEKLARRYLQPLIDAHVDVLVLGCTHYPLLTELLTQVMGPSVVLVSSAQETAHDVQRIVEQENVQQNQLYTRPTMILSQTGTSPLLSPWAEKLITSHRIEGVPSEEPKPVYGALGEVRRAVVG